MLGVHVEGGTGAGSKRPKKDPPKPWYCKCRETTYATGTQVRVLVNRGHHGWEKRCDQCGVHRP